MLTNQAGALEKLDSVEQLWSETIRILTGHGCEFFIYITIDQDANAPFVLTNVPEIYALIDPTTDPFLSHCCNSYEITKTGPAYLPGYDYLPESAQAFIRRASLTGFQTGLGIPMRLQGSARYGGFNVGTRLDPATFEAKILPRAEEFRLFCLLIHRRIEELTRDGMSVDGPFRDLLVAPQTPNLADLSPREKEVIYLVAQGVSRKECARLCGISPNTVAEYTKSAYRKLGVQNRVEAARVVIQQAS